MINLPERYRQELLEELNRKERAVRNRICNIITSGETLTPQDAVQAWIEVAKIAELGRAISQGEKAHIAHVKKASEKLTPPGQHDTV